MINEINNVHEKRLDNLLMEFNKFLPLLKIKEFKFAKTLNKSQPFKIKDKNQNKIYFSSYCYDFLAALDENEIIADSFNNDSPQFNLSAVYDAITDKVEVNSVKFRFMDLNDPVLFYLIDSNSLSILKPLITEISEFILENSSIIEYLTVQVSFKIDGTFDNLSLFFKYYEFNYSSNSHENYYTNNISLYDKLLIKDYELNIERDLRDFAEMTFLSISNPDMLDFFSCSDWHELWNMYSENPESIKSILEMNS